MLPESRTKVDLFSIPKFTVEKKDVDGFVHELRGYHELFSDCFAREEPRENFFRYMAGQFSELIPPVELVAYFPPQVAVLWCPRILE